MHLFRSWLVALSSVSTCVASPAFASNANGTKQQAPAVDPSLKVTVEPVGLVAGGKRAGLLSAQQVELDLAIDWGKIAQLDGLTSHVTLVNRTGFDASKRLIGDNVLQSQAVYGGTFHKPIHLVQAYFEDKLDGGRWDLAAGRLPVGEAFASSPLYCGFMNTALCGYPHALAAKQGFSTFPNSTWGARAKFSPGKSVYAQAGAYQVRPQAGGPWGLNWGWSGTTGTYLPVEIGWEPTLRGGRLPGHYKIGVGYDTSSYKDNFQDATGAAFALSGRQPAKRHGRYSAYVLADQMLARHGEGDQNGLIMMGGYVHSRPANSEISSFGFVGLADQGLLASRPKDTAGLLFAYAKVSSPAVRTERIEESLGEPLLFDANGVQSHEALIEARYDVVLNKQVDVMPDVQYVIRPGATRYQGNALLAGARLTIKL